MKTLVFDFDGTLADSFELVVDIAHELTGIARKSDEEIAHLRHLPLLKAARELGISYRKLPRMMIQGRQMMLERIEEVHPFKGIPDVLKKLYERGYHMLVISSNSEKNVRTFLRANNLESFFDGVYGNASLINKAQVLRKVLKRNKLAAAECYYIGDEVRDIVAASKVGMLPVSVKWGYQAPDALAAQHPVALVDAPRDLLQLFDESKV